MRRESQTEEKRETERRRERDELHNHLGVGMGQKGWEGREPTEGGNRSKKRGKRQIVRTVPVKFDNTVYM